MNQRLEKKENTASVCWTSTYHGTPVNIMPSMPWEKKLHGTVVICLVFGVFEKLSGFPQQLLNKECGLCYLEQKCYQQLFSVLARRGPFKTWEKRKLSTLGKIGRLCEKFVNCWGFFRTAGGSFSFVFPTNISLGYPKLGNWLLDLRLWRAALTLMLYCKIEWN